MDNVYDFKWLIDDIDSSLIFVLRDGKRLMGSYQVRDILSNGYERASVKFANIGDLTNFVNYGFVRFTEFNDENNIIDIPIRKLNYLYAHSNNVGKEGTDAVELREVDGFGIYDGSPLGKGYALLAYKVNEPSHELDEIMMIASSFNTLMMNDKISALERMNLLNYQREKAKGHNAK